MTRLLSFTLLLGTVRYTDSLVLQLHVRTQEPGMESFEWKQPVGFSLFSFSLFFFFFFCLLIFSIVALQCCVHFCCTVKWISYMYTYIPFRTCISFRSPQCLKESSLCWSMFPLVTYFIYSIDSVYVSIPISQFLPPTTFPLGIHIFVLYVCVSISALQIRSCIPFL